MASTTAAESKVAPGQGPLKKLTQEQMESFARDGFVRVSAKDMWTPEEVSSIVKSVEDMQKWPEVKGEYMMYFENNTKATADDKAPKRILQRVEKFVEYDKYLNSVVNGKLKDFAAQLFGEEAIMYKEKINFKLPGGGGFAPHQDHAAGWWLYGADLHISALVSIDPSDASNGALEVVRGEHKKGLLAGEWEEIPKDLVDQWDKEKRWEVSPTVPGDVIFFDSFVPHRSGPNPTDTTRRIMYITYGKAAQGDHRDKFLRDKRKNLPPDIEREPDKKYEYKV